MGVKLGSSDPGATVAADSAGTAPSMLISWMGCSGIVAAGGGASGDSGIAICRAADSCEISVKSEGMLSVEDGGVNTNGEVVVLGVVVSVIAAAEAGAGAAAMAAGADDASAVVVASAKGLYSPRGGKDAWAPPPHVIGDRFRSSAVTTMMLTMATPSHARILFQFVLLLLLLLLALMAGFASIMCGGGAGTCGSADGTLDCSSEGA